MVFPMRQAAGRAALIGAMLAGGLLYAGISQAQEIATDAQAERGAELAAATGGPAPVAHLIPFEADKAAVEVRADDVAEVAHAPSARPLPASTPASQVHQVAAAKP